MGKVKDIQYCEETTTATFHIISSFQTIPPFGALCAERIWFKDAVEFTSSRYVGEGYPMKGWEQLWSPEQACVTF